MVSVIMFFIGSIDGAIETTMILVENKHLWIVFRVHTRRLRLPGDFRHFYTGPCNLENFLKKKKQIEFF